MIKKKCGKAKYQKIDLLQDSDLQKLMSYVIFKRIARFKIFIQLKEG